MANVPKRLYVGQPSTDVATVYTAPTLKTVIVKNIVLCNTSRNLSAITVHVVPSGSTATKANKVVAELNVSGNDTIVIDLSTVLQAGDSLQLCQSTIGSITTYISGVEIS